VVRNSLKNVPDEGIYAFAPVAFFGVYMPDTFWFDKE
jgi:peptide/nickel transport system substrate-binding protein